MFLIIWFAFGLVGEVVAFEKLPLGASFDLGTKIVVPILALGPATIAVWFGRRMAARRVKPQKFEWSTRWIVVWILAVAVLMTVFFGCNAIEQHAKSNAALQADRYFDIRYSSAIGQEVDTEEVQATLAAIERARRDVLEGWPSLTHSSAHTLYLFRDITEFQKEFGGAHSAGAVACTPDGPVIGMPLEEVPTFWEGHHPKKVPTHEMIHAAMCDALGVKKFYRIPRWFHEGMAALHQEDGIDRVFLNRAMSRFVVSWRRNEILSPEEFCSYRADGPAQEVGLFYATSFEFARWLQHRHGRESLHNSIDSINSGATFSRYLKGEFGADCRQLYANWTGRF